MSGGSSFGKNVVIFGAGMSSSVYLDNEKKDIKFNYKIKKKYLILGKGPTQGLYNTTLSAEAEYSINFTEK